MMMHPSLSYDTCHGVDASGANDILPGGFVMVTFMFLKVGREGFGRCGMVLARAANIVKDMSPSQL